MRTTVKRLGLALAATVTAAAAAVTVAPSAQAWEGDGRCEVGELCLYWGSNYSGAYRDYLGSVYDFAGHRFPNNGTGGGTAVKNNAASVVNRNFRGAHVYYNEGYSGPSDYVPAYSRRNLYYTWNDNASMSKYPCNYPCDTAP